MGAYQIGDVERLLDVKAHVLRYWEKEIPLLQPRKDLAGRRVYTQADLRILLRLKHLLYERRFTLEGAREQLFRELSGGDQDARAVLNALRSELIELFAVLRSSAKDDHERDPLSPAEP